MGQMDASERIAAEFDRLVALGHAGVAARPLAERVLFYVVVCRCAADVGGFASVYEQALDSGELVAMAGGLDCMGETELAAEVRGGLDALAGEGFYRHRDWSKVSPTVKAQIDAIGGRMGGRLWDLDEKLAALLDDAAKPRVLYNGTWMAADWPARIEAAQLVKTYVIGGVERERIPYGREKDEWPDGPCHDCGVLKGQLHVEQVCDVEECPVCGGQVIACSCPYEHPSKSRSHIAGS